MKQKLTTEETDTSTIIVGDFNRPLSTFWKNKSTKISKNIQDLNNTIKPIDIYTTLYTTAEYKLFSSIPGTFTKIDMC